jgi:hypothetical protein
MRVVLGNFIELTTVTVPAGIMPQQRAASAQAAAPGHNRMKNL